MQQKKRSYSDELKSEAVRMVTEQGLSQEEAGRRLSIPRGTIANWVVASKSGTEPSRPGDPSEAELAAENQRLRKELHEARMEREIQKSSRVLCQGIAARYAFTTARSTSALDATSALALFANPRQCGPVRPLRATASPSACAATEPTARFRAIRSFGSRPIPASGRLCRVHSCYQ